MWLQAGAVLVWQGMRWLLCQSQQPRAAHWGAHEWECTTESDAFPAASHSETSPLHTRQDGAAGDTPALLKPGWCSVRIAAGYCKTSTEQWAQPSRELCNARVTHTCVQGMVDAAPFQVLWDYCTPNLQGNSFHAFKNSDRPHEEEGVLGSSAARQTQQRLWDPAWSDQGSEVMLCSSCDPTEGPEPKPH